MQVFLKILLSHPVSKCDDVTASFSLTSHHFWRPNFVLFPLPKSGTRLKGPTQIRHFFSLISGLSLTASIQKPGNSILGIPGKCLRWGGRHMGSLREGKDRRPTWGLFSAKVYLPVGRWKDAPGGGRPQRCLAGVGRSLRFFSSGRSASEDETRGWFRTRDR